MDNYPFGWADGTGAFGAGDVDWNGNGSLRLGDALEVGLDRQLGRQPARRAPRASNGPGFEGLDAFDGLRNFNQVRPGVFDGGYAFNGIPAGIYIVEAKAPPGYEFVKEEDKNVDFGDEYQGVTVGAEGNPVMPDGPAGQPASHHGSAGQASRAGRRSAHRAGRAHPVPRRPGSVRRAERGPCRTASR